MRGLLGPDHNIVQRNLDDEELKACVDAGASFTATVLTEMHGLPPPLTLAFAQPRLRACNDIDTIVRRVLSRDAERVLMRVSRPASDAAEAIRHSKIPVAHARVFMATRRSHALGL